MENRRPPRRASAVCTFAVPTYTWPAGHFMHSGNPKADIATETVILISEGDASLRVPEELAAAQAVAALAVLLARHRLRREALAGGEERSAAPRREQRLRRRSRR